MMLYAIRMLRRQPLRLASTVGGMTLCVMLTLFLHAVYEGVERGSMSYIRALPADVWVLQEGASNILRGTSILPSALEGAIRERADVHSTGSLLLLLTTLHTRSGESTVYLAAFGGEPSIGAEPVLIEGRQLLRDDEIILDRAFAGKAHLAVGDWLLLRADSLRVVGIADGTNMVVIQYAFVTPERARSLIAPARIVTCVLVRTEAGADPALTARAIEEEFPGLAAYTREEFLANNLREVRSGILPLLFAVALMGSVLLTGILATLLTLTIIEQKREFAVLKTIGAPPGFIPGIVIAQGMLLALGGFAIACGGFPALAWAIEYAAPEVTPEITLSGLLSVLSLVTVAGLLGIVGGLLQLRQFTPQEAFR
jgi:putative ABC transport system permease protein